MLPPDTYWNPLFDTDVWFPCRCVAYRDLDTGEVMSVSPCAQHRDALEAAVAGWRRGPAGTIMLPLPDPWR